MLIFRQDGMGISCGSLHPRGTDALVLSVCVLQLTHRVVPLNVNLMYYLCMCAFGRHLKRSTRYHP